MKRTLIIVRHAKSSWQDAEMKDYDRPLNDRGKRDAPVMADIMTKQEDKPDRIVSSGAKRALTTAGHYAKAFGLDDSSIKVDDRIYEAAVSDLIAVINDFDDVWGKVILFGHNPGFSYLVQYLSGQMIQMPTNGVVRFDIDIDSWKHIGTNCAELKYHDFPKKNSELL